MQMKLLAKARHCLGGKHKVVSLVRIFLHECIDGSMQLCQKGEF